MYPHKRASYIRLALTQNRGGILPEHGRRARMTIHSAEACPTLSTGHHLVPDVDAARWHAIAMPFLIPQECQRLIASQRGVISLRQAMAAGLTASAVKNRVRCGDWQRMQRGVYATFTGPPEREAQLWAALLRAGPDAMLSHYTAAERHGLLSGQSQAIHVAVPRDRSPARRGKIPGVVIHQSDAILRGRHQAMAPPCTRIDDTVLDLIAISRTIDDAYNWICTSIGNRRTTASRLREALDARPRFPGRREIEVAIGDASEGALSWLERRYARDVERRHGLPAATRQARADGQGGNRYLDNLYEDYRLCVELDGSAAHPADQQWRDKRRDRASLVIAKIVTIRVGYLDVCDREHQCATAAEVAMILSGRGTAVGQPCDNPACPVIPA